MSFRELIQGTGIILLDGAMGTELSARGLEPSGEQNLQNPDVVRAIHEGYLHAGARALTTNTLTMNRIFLESHGRGSVDVAEVNRKGVQLARSVAGDGLAVLGDISSTGQLLQPYGDAREEDLLECFREQTSILEEAGVDGFIIETMIDLREAILALRACRRESVKPILATISFSMLKDGGRTVMGNGVNDCALALSGEGADAIGVNCGELDPFEVARIISFFRKSTSLPLIAQPNAGKPRIADGKTVFDLGPEVFADGLAECITNGARIVGGCCGTSPLHIRAAAQRLGV